MLSISLAKCSSDRTSPRSKRIASIVSGIERSPRTEAHRAGLRRAVCAGRACASSRLPASNGFAIAPIKSDRGASAVEAFPIRRVCRLVAVPDDFALPALVSADALDASVCGNRRTAVHLRRRSRRGLRFMISLVHCVSLRCVGLKDAAISFVLRSSARVANATRSPTWIGR